MNDQHTNTWGSIGVISVIVGILSWFAAGIWFSLIAGFAAVTLGFIGARRKQRLCLTGMLFGGITLMFVNLMSMGIIPIPSALTSDKTHLVNSIKASIQVYEILGRKPFGDEERVKVIEHLKWGLEEAHMIDIEKVDEHVPGFSSHFSDEYITGVESLIEGYEKSDISRMLKGGLLLDRWGKWNNENRDQLGGIKEPVPSLISFLKAIVAH